MEYVLLSKLFYQDREKQKALYQKRYESESTYHFNFYVKEHPAFCVISKEIHALCCNIYEYKSKLYEMLSQIPGDIINHFTKTCLIDEVKLTNEIEGVQSTRQEINALIEHLPSRKKNSRLYGLVKKYLLLLDINEEIPLNACEDIRSLYNELCLPEVIAEDKNNAPDGKLFRKEIVNVLSPTQKPIHQGSYPEAKIISEMEQALNILHDEKIPSLIRIAVFHYLFGYIHPFYDGNGRMSRYISSLYLNDELDILCALQLSSSCKERKNDYYRAFKFTNDVRNKADLTGFVIIFLEIIVTGLENLLEIVSDKLEQYNLNKKMLKEICDKEDVYHLLNVFLQCTLFDNEGLSYYDLMNITNLSRTTIINKIKDIKNSSLKDLLIERKISREKHYQLNIDKLYDMV